MKGALASLSWAVVSPVSANWLPVFHIRAARPSSASAMSTWMTAFCRRSARGGMRASSESNSTCSPRSDTSGRAPKMKMTISSSVISSEPGIEFSRNLRPSTSKKVSTMMPNRARPASRPQASSRIFFIVWVPGDRSRKKRTAAKTAATPRGVPPLQAMPCGLFRGLGDLGAELGEHLGGILQALGLRVLGPLLLERLGPGLHVRDEFRIGLRDLHAVRLHQAEGAAIGL